MEPPVAVGARWALVPPPGSSSAVSRRKKKPPAKGIETVVSPGEELKWDDDDALFCASERPAVCDSG